MAKEIKPDQKNPAAGQENTPPENVANGGYGLSRPTDEKGGGIASGGSGSAPPPRK